MNKNQNVVANVPATMAGIMLCLFLSALDGSIVATAMPSIVSSLNGLNHYSLPFTSYLLFSTVVIPVAGKISDIYGRKRVVLAGIGFFLLSSLLCGMSSDMTMLVIFRGIQGASSGVIASSSFIITSELFPPDQRGKYIGILASMHGLASILGPLTGGVITDLLSWRWIFFINMPIGLISILILRKHLPLMKHDGPSGALDIKGVLLFLSSLFPLLFCLTEGGRLFSWTSPWTILLFVTSLMLLLLFIRVERRSPSPLMPPGILSNPVFRKSLVSAAMAYVTLFGLIVYVPYLLQIILKRGATFSGMIMMPMSVSMVAGGVIGGILISKFKQFRLSAVRNFLIAIAGMLPLIIFKESIPLTILAAGILVTGLGIGMNFPVVNLAPQSLFPESQLGITISTVEFFQIMGGVISTSVFGALIQYSVTSILVICVLALLTGLISMSSLDDKTIIKGFSTR